MEILLSIALLILVLVIIFKDTIREYVNDNILNDESNDESSGDCIGQWNGGWTNCSKTCGGGIQQRVYLVTSNKIGDGEDCPHENGYTELRQCNEQECVDDNNCQGEWGNWEPCSVECGDGTMKRTFSVTRAKTGNGVECPHANDEEETEICVETVCDPCVGSWSAYGACSPDCGDGTQTRIFEVTDVGEEGGQACEANDGDEQERACNNRVCDDCTGSWGEWSSCSGNCGTTGTRTRTYTISNQGDPQGEPCESETGTQQSEECTNSACVTCTWPQVIDPVRNVCVAAPDIPDGTVGTHSRCITDSDCMLGRCAGPTGDPGCYGRYTCTGNPLPPGCGNNNSASGCVGRSRC
jgi:hypothetical protein